MGCPLILLETVKSMSLTILQHKIMIFFVLLLIRIFLIKKVDFRPLDELTFKRIRGRGWPLDRWRRGSDRDRLRRSRSAWWDRLQRAPRACVQGNLSRCYTCNTLCIRTKKQPDIQKTMRLRYWIDWLRRHKTMLTSNLDF